MRKSWWLFHDRSLLLRSIGALSCRSWSIAQECGVRLPIHILNYWTELSGVLFFYLVIFWNATLPIYDHWQCFNIKSNQIHHFSGALPLPYVPVRVTRGALVAHWHSFAPPRCRTSQYRRTFVPQCLVGTILVSWWPCIWWWGTGGF